MRIHNNNVAELVFMDKKLQRLLPEHENLFNQWVLGQRIPAMRFLSQKSEFELLERLDDNMSVLEEYFGEKVGVSPIDYHIARHHKVPIGTLEVVLNELDEFADYFSISRDAEYAYLSFWR